MWIEMLSITATMNVSITSCHVCGMWIEIMRMTRRQRKCCRHATYVACGLKFDKAEVKMQSGASCHVCGMWIEIIKNKEKVVSDGSCHVCGMWIEIFVGASEQNSAGVMPRMWHVD